ncbi:hypothetical protein LZ31DRAFT_484160, partial [Colletotrichum somersetense]
ENSQGFLMFLPGRVFLFSCVSVTQGNARGVWAAQETKGKKREHGMAWAVPYVPMSGPDTTRAPGGPFLYTDRERFVSVIMRPGSVARRGTGSSSLDDGKLHTYISPAPKTSGKYLEPHVLLPPPPPLLLLLLPHCHVRLLKARG